MGVPQLPIPTLLWLDTTQLTPARALAASAHIFAETRHEEFEPCEQTTGSPGSVRIGRGHVDGNGKTQRIHEDVPFPLLDVLVGIVAADPRRLLNRFHALRIPGFRHLGQDAFLVVRVEGGATLATRASRFHTRRKRRKW